MTCRMAVHSTYADADLHLLLLGWAGAAVCRIVPADVWRRGEAVRGTGAKAQHAKARVPRRLPSAQRRVRTPVRIVPVRNREVDWGQFDPESYCMHNYRSPLAVDLDILRRVRDFFGAWGPVDGRGLDIGAGPNLYPSLAMVPFCRRIDLREYSRKNVDWLERRITEGYESTWDEFWDVLALHPAYKEVTDPRQAYSARATAAQGSIFDLEPRSWDIATMFFVACSISSDIAEFDLAVGHFVRALKPGAPFAAAFMLGSTGYDVNGVPFPSVRLTSDDVVRTFARSACDVDVTKIETKQLIRPGYSGMALAIGRAGLT